VGPVLEQTQSGTEAVQYTVGSTPSASAIPARKSSTKSSSPPARPPAAAAVVVVGGPDADRTSDKRHDEGKDAWWMDGDEEVEGAPSPLIRIDHR